MASSNRKHMETLEMMFKTARQAAREVNRLSPEKINTVLLALADEAVDASDELLEANRQDLAKLSKDEPCYDRLLLTTQRIHEIADGIRKVAELQSPVGRVLKHTVLPNGLDLQKVSVPFGVIGVVYEARPNVSFDVFTLCLKAGSACILKGGKDAEASNKAIVTVIKRTLQKQGLSEGIVTLLPATHEATAELLAARAYVDLLIPRGGSKLIQFVRDNAKVPVIETGAGVCHIYFDKDGDEEKGQRIIVNAKTRRVSVCNALDCLLVHSSRLSSLALLLSPMSASNVLIHSDERALAALQGRYPSQLLKPAMPEDDGREYLAYEMLVRTVDSLDEALAYIDTYGSRHSESIVTENEATAERFLKEVDAACVYQNAPTSFTDGGQFGLGAEIGISTQKLHARGPMGLEEITTYKWIIHGNGQVRP